MSEEDLYVMNRKQMLKLKEIDEKIDQLYAMKEKIICRILKNKGDSVGFMKISEENATTDEQKAKPWMRVQLFDNSAPFDKMDDQPGKVKAVYRVARFCQYEAKIEYLKNEPKERVEMNEKKKAK